MTKIKLEGMAELEKALRELGKATGKNVTRRALKNASQKVVEEAQILVPVDQGELMDSIIASNKLDKKQKHRKSRDTVDMFIGPTVYYGHFVEFGTKKQSPQPFMRPAWESTKQEALDSISSEMWSEINKAVVRKAKRAAKK